MTRVQQKAFADLSLATWVPRQTIEYNKFSEQVRTRAARDGLCLFDRRRYYSRFPQKSRRFFRRCGVDVEPGAPLESRYLCQLRNDLDMPVIMIVDFFSDR